jgi:deazaflavin-dependent oxidoreductase (nitroreductase family)
MSIMNKRRAVTGFQKHVANPVARAANALGLPVGVVTLETTGRRSGRPRRTPVGRALEGDTLWIVTEHGRRAGYVRNIQANPRVRVRIGRRWRTGTARLLAEDDPRERQRLMPNKLNSAVVRALGTEHITVRIDLDPDPGRRASGSRSPRSDPGPG